ncbi:MAG TPA: PKD domain-containing protein, partial [Bacteroidales bacterium]|nr:PKD domain-containing protein [Bacteroidales bacterium]
MKRLIISLLVVVFSVSAMNVFAQLGHGGEPISFKNPDLLSTYIDHIQLAKPDMALIEAEDNHSDKDGTLYMIGRFIDVDRDINDCGTWDVLPNGTRVWRLKISVPDAKALSVFYDNFYLPQGTQLFIYNQNHKQLVGSLDYRNNPRFSNMYSTEIIEGETTYLELIVSPEATELPAIEIGEVCYIYRGVDPLIGRFMDSKPPTFGGSGACEVNVNCPEGSGWQDQKKGVAVIFCNGGLCSGTLVNNTSNDGTPYFLTADHCGGSTGTVPNWQYYFNYEGSGCTDPASAPAYNTITGSTLRSRGDEDTGSDFLLVELNCTEDELETIGAYYNGWDRSTTGSPSGVSIHHPDGDIKKISSYNTPCVSGTFNTCPANAHWKAVWYNAGTSLGVTEPGSSGSPLFNNNKLVVGTLSGGPSSCGVAAANCYDLYGKFDYHWETNGTADNVRLKPWLDPTSSGATTCPGRFPNSGASSINAQFIGTPTTVNVGGTVAFTDQSTGGATTWSWTFDGGTPGTTMNQNPTVNYPTAGTYNVTLTAGNGTETDTEIKTGYIIVTSGASTLDAAFAASAYNIFEGECINFQDQSTGNPTSWAWTFPGSNTPTSPDQNPVNVCYNVAGTYNVSLTVQNATDTNTENCTGCITVVVNPVNPIADFSGSPLIIPVGGVVTFTNLSQNGPFIEPWAWTFEGGIPNVSNDSVPQPIMYNTVGTYDVELLCSNTLGVQDIELKHDYIKVIPAATEPPVANFVANYTVIQPGDAINFIDLSLGNPYQWEWTIQGGDPSDPTVQNPSNVIFALPGIYDVQLIVRNNLGVDTLIREDYIVVSATDPCVTAPVASFTAAPRLITAGQVVYMQDQSTGLPANWNWIFEGGNPQFSTEGSITEGVLYSVPGIYNVTLAVNNICGSDMLIKDDYIYVFSGPVTLFCDTLSNIGPNETVGTIVPQDAYGFIAGHNGERVRAYADYFEDYTFGQIESLIVPVERAVYGSYNSYVRFMIWDWDGDTIGEVLGEKKVYIRDLQANFNNVITFNPPVEIDGPFYAGFRLNYPDENNDGYCDDQFVVSIANPRGANESYNTMYVLDGIVWKSNVEMFGFATSLAIKPLGCLV